MFTPLSGKRIALDTETTGLHPWKGDRPFMIQFCNEHGDTTFVEWRVNPFTRQVIYDRQLVEVKKYLEKSNVFWVLHHAKFDVRMLEAVGIVLPFDRIDDTMFMLHCCNTLEFNYKLKYQAKLKCGYPDDDEKTLKEAVRKSRLAGKKLGWNLAYSSTVQWNGEIKTKGEAGADYWIPRELVLRHPDLAPQSFRTVCSEYGVRDVERTQLLDQGVKQFGFDKGIKATYDFEMRKVWPATYRMETRGVRLDRSIVEKELAASKKEIAENYRIVEKATWPNFNFNSHPQVRKFVYGICGLPVSLRTKTGLPSTSFGNRSGQSDLIERSATLPALRALIKAKAADKAINGFFGKFVKLAVREGEGLILHPSFEQRGPATTRFSCREPNLQNVPGLGTTFAAEPMRIRAPFGPRPGYSWLHVDYNNMEMRIFADFAEELEMLDQFSRDEDVHGNVCNRVWGGKGNPIGISETLHALELDGTGKKLLDKQIEVQAAWKELGIKSLEKKTYDYLRGVADAYLKKFDYDIVKSQKALDKKTTRVKAKMVSFTKIYGGGPKGICKQIKVPLKEAQHIMSEYDRQYPRIKHCIDGIIATAKKQGFICTAFGDRISVERDFAYRAVNYKVQGTAAQILKRAMVRCADFLQGMQSAIVMCIHDELVFEMQECEFTRKNVRALCGLMEETDGVMKVHMKVEPEVVTDQWIKKRELIY